MLYTIVPASLSHFSSSGFNLHIFLKLRLSASKREMVVWLKSFPYSFPISRPTSPWNTHRIYLNLIMANFQIIMLSLWSSLTTENMSLHYCLCTVCVTTISKCASTPSTEVRWHNKSEAVASNPRADRNIWLCHDLCHVYMISEWEWLTKMITTIFR